jgi:hypothetical protein
MLGNWWRGTYAHDSRRNANRIKIFGVTVNLLMFNHLLFSAFSRSENHKPAAENPRQL